MRTAAFRSAWIGCTFVAADTAAAQPCLRWDRIEPEPFLLKSTEMAFDSGRGVVVATGYLSAITGMRLWEWDGQVWRDRTQAGPPRRFGYAVAYDEHRGRLVMHAGGWARGAYVDTWEWDGTAWEQTGITGPGPRIGHSMTYDTVRREIVMIGGRDHNGVWYSDETWAWDEQAWRRRANSGPGPRRDAALAFDPRLGKAVLFGGRGPTGDLSDTWTWDGDRWERISAAGPPAGEEMAAGFDPLRGGMLLHLRDDRSQTWLFDGAAWSLLSLGAGPWFDIALAVDTARAEVIGIAEGSFYIGRAADPAIRIHPSPFNLHLTEGEPLALDSDGCGTVPLVYQWRRSGVALRDDGRISGVTTPALRIDPTIVADDGEYDLVVSNGAGSAVSQAVRVYVRPIPPCYADCDTSTGFEVLDVFDFLCFQNAYEAKLPYACDCDTGTHVYCDIFDFLCFQQRFAQGCP